MATTRDKLAPVCSGGYIEIKSGDMEIGGPGKLLVKNTGTKKVDSGSMQGMMESFEPESFDENFIISSPAPGRPVASQKYEIHMPDENVITEIADAMRYSFLAASEVSDGLKIILRK